jgi:L-rhamnose isomerase
MQALADGPRAADQFAAVTACLVTLIATCTPAQDMLAKFVLAVANALERARAQDDSIAASNLLRVVCYLYLCKAIGVQPLGIWLLRIHN